METHELKVGSLSALQKSRGGLIAYHEALKDEVVLQVKRDGTVGCFSTVCPHAAGEVVPDDSGGFFCKWHGLEFDAEGRGTNCRAKLSLRQYETRVSGDDIYLKYEL